MTEWHAIPEIKEMLEAAGLADFDSLASKPIGESINKDSNGREVRRLVLSDKGEPFRFYLKRSSRVSLTHLLRMLLVGRRPMSASIREKTLIELMQQAGVAMMEPVAWGERRRFGFPRCGFLLVREVIGEEVADIYRNLSKVDQQKLFNAIGRFVGRLHKSGFYQPVRIKDLFCSAETNFEQDKIDLVLIDRETGKPWASRFSSKKCVRSLARSFRRQIREDFRMGPLTMRAFTEGYLAVIADVWAVDRKTLYRQVYSCIIKELR